MHDSKIICFYYNSCCEVCSSNLTKIIIGIKKLKGPKQKQPKVRGPTRKPTEYPAALSPSLLSQGQNSRQGQKFHIKKKANGVKKKKKKISSRKPTAEAIYILLTFAEQKKKCIRTV